MGGFQYNIDNPAYIPYLRKYFKIRDCSEDENLKLEIEELYTGFGDTHFYHDKTKGRILIFIVTQLTDYDVFLLFSPLGNLEKSSINIGFNGYQMELIVKEIIKKNLEFRNKIMKDFCQSREYLNISFKKLGLKFNFFSDYEKIAALNPLCANNDNFTDVRTVISTALDSFKENKVKNFLNLSTDENINSIKALEKLLKKIKKYDQFKDELEKLRLIRSIRNIHPVHNTNKQFVTLLNAYNINTPRDENEDDWCDLGVFIIQEISRILREISEGIDPKH